VVAPFDATTVLEKYLRSICDEWSRCETGVRRACSAQAPEMTQANAVNLVPLPYVDRKVWSFDSS